MKIIIIIIRIIKKKEKKKKDKSRLQGWTDSGNELEREREKTIFFLFIFSLFLSQIYENRTVGFRRSRRQNWYTRRELRIGTNILAFCQTLKCRKFSYLYYFEPKIYIMA